MSFEVIPAIDLRGGRVVRLRQGDYGAQTVFETSAEELAGRYAAAGARWLHVVDLDGARSGQFRNLRAIEAMARTGGLRIQAGGGVRGLADLQRLYAAGVGRVVVGTRAVEDPATTATWIARFGPERLVLALDVRREAGAWQLPVDGWTRDSGVRLEDLAQVYVGAGAHHVLCTDVARDGMLGGVNRGLYRDLHRLAPGLAVQASGGVSGLDDVRDVRAAGASAVVLGRALLEQRFSLGDALAC